LPTFWLALLLLLVFGEKLGWVPRWWASDPIFCPVVDSAYCLFDRLWHLALPAATLGLVGAAGTGPLPARGHAGSRKSGLRAHGARQGRPRAAGRAAPSAPPTPCFPLLRASVFAFPFLLTGAVLIETVFAWPGMGRLAFDAILTRDYALVTATALIASVVVVAGNLLADVLLGIADPRLRSAQRRRRREHRRMTLGSWLALFVALIGAAEIVRALRQRGLKHERWRRFFRNRTTSWGLGILVFLVIIAIAAPLVAPLDPIKQT